jgi:hypothetical protein
MRNHNLMERLDSPLDANSFCKDLHKEASAAIWQLEHELELAKDALISMLNVEHAARLGATHPAASGLDVAWHFEKARRALNGKPTEYPATAS